ncbi:MAG TPA: RNA 2',3'-cyclic phosphodiesterase [Solirubrobacteraceae bacterium]|jgi:2'-5' RNA ligase|nr:RNA 2',3'-cyclic phosphodiesterase [Solirubrobacteraceae bacterium]
MSGEGTARLFVAVDPPQELCAELTAWARLVADVYAQSAHGSRMRVLARDSLHLTLCFLGSRPVEEIEPLAEAVRECVAPVGELELGAPLLLPPRRPRALAVEIRDPGGELSRLQAQVVSSVSGASSWEPSERRGFRAHVTVARMGGDSRRQPALGPLPATPQLSFRATRICLYRSWLEPAGACYEELWGSELPQLPH